MLIEIFFDFIVCCLCYRISNVQRQARTMIHMRMREKMRPYSSGEKERKRKKEKRGRSCTVSTFNGKEKEEKRENDVEKKEIRMCDSLVLNDMCVALFVLVFELFL